MSLFQAGILIALAYFSVTVLKGYQAHGSVSVGHSFLSGSSKKYLEKHFSFYRKLPVRSKAIFAKRVAQFINHKKFIPRHMDFVTREMKVLIAASAIQLSFGFPRIKLSWFRYILVFPDVFYSKANQAHHKGEVNPKAKSIVLSWKHFVEGYLSADGRNLGLHEMAHALRLENRIKNQEYNFLSAELLQEWEMRAQLTMQEIRNGTETFFRKYGAVDREEFFAVAVENFFERPKLFSSKHPQTYQTMCSLLRQDPLQLEENVMQDE